MPHIRIDYTANLEQAVQDSLLVRQLHQAAIATGVFPVWGVRTFAQPVAQYQVGNGDPGNGFLLVNVRIGPGRELAVRQRVLHALFEVVQQALAPQFAQGRLGCQIDLTEFDAALNSFQINLAGSDDPAEAVVCRRP